MARTTLYNAKGSPAAESAMADKDDGFKRGGKAKKRKRGGMVEGSKVEERLDRKERGRARGGSVMSAGNAGRDEGTKNAGHEGESV